MTEQQEYVIEPSIGKLFNGKELWTFRELFYFFTWRDIKIKYKQTALGFLWAVLQPLMMMFVLTFFVGRAMNVPSQSLPYPVFVYSGLIIWNTFSFGLTNASASMVNNSAIIKKIYFPRVIIPLSSILVALFDFCMAFIVFIGLLIYFKQPVSLDALWCWPLALFFCVVATLGPGCLFSALTVKYRDFRYVIPFVVQLLFFVSPIIYPVSFIKYPALQYAVSLSPVYAAIELFRYPLLDSPVMHSNLLMASGGSGILFLILGLIYFRRTEHFFADLA